MLLPRGTSSTYSTLLTPRKFPILATEAEDHGSIVVFEDIY